MVSVKPTTGLKYWRVDPDAMTVTVLLLGEHGYQEGGTCRSGESVESPTLEGFSAKLDDIFQR